MIQKLLFAIPQAKTLPSAGLLLFRITFGTAFALHGLPKFQNAFNWMGDVPVPGILQALAALAEFGGGIALILGLLTPLASLGIIFTMIAAMLMVHLPMGHPFVATKPGEASGEAAMVYLAAALMFLTNGPGRYSLDYFLSGAAKNSIKQHPAEASC